MNRSIDQFILQKNRRPATLFRYLRSLWFLNHLMIHPHRSTVGLASPLRGRRLSGIASGRWEVMIP